MNADTKIALGALVISILSIGISLVSLYQQKRISVQNLQAIYFKELFQEYLLQKIPEAALKLNFDNTGKLKITYREINQVMMKMISGAKYFMFADFSFYSELKSKAQNLEDELADLSNRRIIDIKEQGQAIIHINTLISEIVAFINKKYCK